MRRGALYLLSVPNLSGQAVFASRTVFQPAAKPPSVAAG